MTKNNILNSLLSDFTFDEKQMNSKTTLDDKACFLF